jgi:hypothetical protein
VYFPLHGHDSKVVVGRRGGPAIIQTGVFRL